MKIAIRIIALPFMFILQIIVMMKTAIKSSILFLKHGGEWVNFEKNDKDTIRHLLDRKRKSPLFLAVMDAIMEQHVRYIYYKDLDIDDLIALKNSTLWNYVKVYASLRVNATMYAFDEKDNTIVKEKDAGSKLRILMVSRKGDVGVTDNLENEKGYNFRIDPKQLTAWRIELI